MSQLFELAVHDIIVIGKNSAWEIGISLQKIHRNPRELTIRVTVLFPQGGAMEACQGDERASTFERPEWVLTVSNPNITINGITIGKNPTQPNCRSCFLIVTIPAGATTLRRTRKPAPTEEPRRQERPKVPDRIARLDKTPSHRPGVILVGEQPSLIAFLRNKNGQGATQDNSSAPKTEEG